MDDFLKDLFGVRENNEPEVLHEKSKYYKIEELDKNRAFEKNERTVLDGDGQRTEEIKSISKMDCGHFVGLRHDSEMVSECSFCGRTLCMRCQAKCISCGRVGCMEKCMTIVDGEYAICKKCNRLEFGKAILKTIHGFLSKDVL